MSALQLQPQMNGSIYPDTWAEPTWDESFDKRHRSCHVYIVPDSEEETRKSPQRAANVQRLSLIDDVDKKVSARPASKQTPKASAGLAGLNRSPFESALLFLAALFIALSVGVSAGVYFQNNPDPQTTTVAAVQAGDSLWSIAQSLGIEGKTLDEVVADIRILNGLETNVLTPGQVLVVPNK